MRRIATVTLFCLSASIVLARPASAEMTVDMLAEICKSHELPDRQMCGSYLLGVMDAFKTSAMQYGAKIPFCYPKSGLSADDMSLAFRLWESTNPGEKAKPAISGIVTAMTERFPCR
ncbi:hypothetical protein DLREEDagr8_22590 [Dongia sp. agr-C8]